MKWDLMIEHAAILPLGRSAAYWPDGYLALSGGTVAALGAWQDRPSGTARITWRRPGHLVVPAWFNAHTHAAMTLLRGVAEDQPTQRWLSDTIFPLEAALVDPEFVRDGALIACAEMARGGIGGFADGYFHSDQVAEAARSVGLRVLLGEGVFSFPVPGSPDSDTALGRIREQARRYRDDPLVRVSAFVHSVYAAAPAVIAETARVCAELALPLQMHVSESAVEVADCRREYGGTPVQHVRRLGALGPRTWCHHGVHLEPADITALADTGAWVVHCPESNAKLGNGIAPIRELLEAGVPAALGTDGAASNNDLDLLAELRTAVLAQKARCLDSTALPVRAALRLACAGGRLFDLPGALIPGQPADITILALDGFHALPLHDPWNHLVFSARSADVTDLVVAGRVVLEAGRLAGVDSADLARRAEHWRRRVEQALGGRSRPQA